jgi:hypothetical protein
MESPANTIEDEANGRMGGIAKKQRRSDLEEVQLHGLVDILAETGSQSRRHYESYKLESLEAR